MADIEIKNIVKIYGAVKPRRRKKKADMAIPEGKRAVNDVSLTIPAEVLPSLSVLRVVARRHCYA